MPAQREVQPYMIKRSLADLAKILEEASNPESEHREDRKELKPKVTATRRGSLLASRVDPKRRAWYDKRLKEQAARPTASKLAAGPVSEPVLKPAITKVAATQLGGTLLQTLAAAKDAKPKTDGKSKAEPWRRKPGDPIF